MNLINPKLIENRKPIKSKGVRGLMSTVRMLLLMKVPRERAGNNPELIDNGVSFCVY